MTDLNYKRNYDDIIGLEHHTSPTRPHMSLYDRAAQFSPFAALTGYEDCIAEAARLTDEKTELSEDARAELDRRFRMIADNPDAQCAVIYFRPDKLKSGGEYVRVTGSVRYADPICGTLTMSDSTVIPMENVRAFEIAAFAGRGAREDPR